MRLVVVLHTAVLEVLVAEDRGFQEEEAQPLSQQDLEVRSEEMAREHLQRM